MHEPQDIRRLLESWPYDPEHPARIVDGSKGSKVLQVRTPLGLEQLELSGRPDGVRPHGMGSVLEFHLQRLAKAQTDGRETDFELEAEECAELFGEGTLYYFRYLHLFQLRRWDFTIRDTARNLRLFDFVNRHAAREEDRLHLEKWRPYVVRMNACAMALLALEQGEAAKALGMIETAKRQIAALEELDDDTFQFERQRSQMALSELSAQIERMQPVSPLDRLERQLQKAIDSQEFERAAKLRDRIRELRAG